MTNVNTAPKSPRFLRPSASESAPKLPLVKDIIEDTKRTYKRVVAGGTNAAALQAHRKIAEEKSAFIERRIAKGKALATDEARLQDLKDLITDIDAVTA
jgi:hypothetical protein